MDAEVVVGRRRGYDVRAELDLGIRVDPVRCLARPGGRAGGDVEHPRAGLGSGIVEDDQGLGVVVLAVEVEEEERAVGRNPRTGRDASLFIAGPMPRTTDVPSWRPVALKAVEAAWRGQGDLVVFVPEPRDGVPLHYDHHTWEDTWLAVVDVILFWVPRDMQHLPGLTTNVEFGRWESSGRIVFGAPPGAAHVGYLRECAARNDIPTADNLDDAIAAAIEMIDSGDRRTGSERHVPLAVWRSPEFNTWYSDLHRAGRTLLSARVLWLQPGDDGMPLRWIMNLEVENNDRTERCHEVVAFGDLGNAIHARTNS